MTTDTTAPARPNWFKKIFTDYGIIVALIVIVGFFSAMRPDTFPTLGNWGSILQANASIMFIAFGLMIPLIAGHFDLSVAAMAGFAGVLTTGLMSYGTVTSWPLAILIAVLVAVVVGLFNGVLVAYFNLNSLVVTLGTQSILFGAILWYSKGAVIYNDIPQSFKDLGQARPGGIPLPFIFAIIVGLILWYVLYFRPIGRRLYAVGGSPQAARLTGIKVDSLKVGAFVVGAVLCALGGVLQVAQVGSAAPTSGNEFLLPAIAACFLGETSIRRGYYNVWGTMTAVVLVAAGTTGLFMLGAQTWVQPVFNGLVLVIAILAARSDDVRAVFARLRRTPPATPTEPAPTTTAA